MPGGHLYEDEVTLTDDIKAVKDPEAKPLTLVIQFIPPAGPLEGRLRIGGNVGDRLQAWRLWKMAEEGIISLPDKAPEKPLVQGVEGAAAQAIAAEAKEPRSGLVVTG